MRIFLARWGGVLIFLIMMIVAGSMHVSLHRSVALATGSQEDESAKEELPEDLFSPMVRAYVFDIVALAWLVIYFRLSYRKMHTDTFVALFTVSTLEEVVASGSYQEDNRPEHGGLLDLDVLFPGWPVWDVVEFPTKRFILHFDAIPAYTKRVEANGARNVIGRQEMLVRVDTSLYVELNPNGIGRFLSKIGDLSRVSESKRDLSTDVSAKYNAIDPHTGKVKEKRYSTPRMAMYIRDLIEQAVHQSVHTVCSQHDWEWLKINTVELTRDILVEIKPIFQQLGFLGGKSQIFSNPMFVVEQIALDPALRDAYSEPQIAKLRADALAAEGQGLHDYLKKVEAGGVTPTQALAAKSIQNVPANVTIVAAEGGLLGAVGASILGEKRSGNS